jgi:hypothetical protein
MQTMLLKVCTFLICSFILFACSQAPLLSAPTSQHIKIKAKNGQRLVLDKKHVYVDATLTTSQPALYRFKTLHEAVAASVSGSEREPSVIYIEPNVYQMNGSLNDRGLYIHQDWLSLIGLSKDARDVVIADNRGHTLGAQTTSGSSPAETIFVTGTGFRAENLTLGNYCNVDLIYPKNPSKNQTKRSSTITQAYVIGAANPNKTLDKYVFKNVRFISMLDTLAMPKVARTYFESVYIQGTDDFMGGDTIQVLKNSTIHSFTSKPIYHAGAQGMAFIDSTWEVEFADRDDLMLTKNASTLYLINTEFKDLNGKLNSIQWTPYPQTNLKFYTANVTLNGKPYALAPEQNRTALTPEQLKGYSAYALLKGDDDWDPSGERKIHSANANQPINIAISPATRIRTGEQDAQLSASIFPTSANQTINWSLNNRFAELSSVTGKTVNLKANNNGEFPVDVIATARAANGISNQTIIRVEPALIDAPSFIHAPKLSLPTSGFIAVAYELNLKYEQGTRADESQIDWYRVSDEHGSNPIHLASSQPAKPLTRYQLNAGDLGHYLMASIAPKHGRSTMGKDERVISTRPIAVADLATQGVQRFNIATRFENLPTTRQPELITGHWLQDTHYPADGKVNWVPAKVNAWEYGTGINGAANTQGLITKAQGARLLYVQPSQFGDMSLELELNPEKTAAQGFGSPNGQYLEIYIKYDAASQTGYGLRIERTTKYAIATDFTLYEYHQGKGTPISQSISSTAFNPGMKLKLRVAGKTLEAQATSASPQTNEQIGAGLAAEVSLKADIGGNSFGGFGVQHTGTVGAGSRVQLTALSVSY